MKDLTGVELTCEAYRVLKTTMDCLIDTPKAIESKRKAQEIISVLVGGLNKESALSEELLTLYLFVGRAINLGNKEHLKVSQKIIDNLLEAYAPLERKIVLEKKNNGCVYQENGVLDSNYVAQKTYFKI